MEQNLQKGKKKQRNELREYTEWTELPDDRKQTNDATYKLTRDVCKTLTSRPF